MNKIMLCLAVLFLTSRSTQAQNLLHPNHCPPKSSLFAQDNQANKPTALAKRMSSHYAQYSSYADSNAYRYSNNRGTTWGDAQPLPKIFPDIVWKMNEGYFLTEFNYDKQITYSPIDSTRKTLNTYNANNQLLSSLSLNWINNQWDTSDIQVTTYNSIGKPVLMVWIYKFSTGWDTVQREEYSYTGNEMTEKIEYSGAFGPLTLNRKTNVVLSPSGQIDTVTFYSNYNPSTASFQYAERMIYENLSDTLILYWMTQYGSTWNNELKSVITIQNNLAVKNAYFYWNPNTMAYDPQASAYYQLSYNALGSILSNYLFDDQNNLLETYTYTRNANNQIVQYKYLTDSYEEHRRIVYNADNLPVYDTVMHYSATSQTWLDTSAHHYYYESYDNTAVSSVHRDFGALAFPNPATDFLHLEWNTKSQNDISISVHDMQGKLLYSAIEKGSIGDHLRTIAIGQWPTGMYFVTLSTAAGEQDHIRFTKH